MTNLLLSLVSAYTKQIRTSFIQKTNHVTATQEQFLQTLLRRHQATVWGQEYGLAELKTADQFRDRVPVLPYSAYEPYMERIARGEANILTPDRVIYMSMTSGSTGKHKLIPFTQKAKQVRNRVNQASSGFLVAAMERRQIPVGKMLLTSSVKLVGQTSGGIEYGPISVGDLRLNQKLYQQLIAHPFEALQPSDSLARHYVCLLFALGDPQTRVIGANFPILALRLADYLETYAEDLIHDVETGGIAPWLDLDPTLRTKLQRLRTANPQRAAQLRQAFKTEGRLTPRAAWNLSTIVTARGGTSDFYLERFPNYFGDTPIFGGIYASSEATFGVYHDLDDDGTILAIDSGFYEFIPQDQWHLEQPQTLLPCEVKPGQHYRILVTNYNGLYRYDIGDVVEVLGFYNQTPLIVFRYRRGGFLSSISEKTTEFQVTQVMQLLQQDLNVILENFCVTLSDQGIPPHYQVNIELAPGSRLSHPQAFIQQFDRRLQEIHTPYAVKRPDQIPHPHLRILASGSFATLRHRMVQRGIPESQLKFPHISDDRHLLDGLTVEQEVVMECEPPLGVS